MPGTPTILTDFLDQDYFRTGLAFKRRNPWVDLSATNKMLIITAFYIYRRNIPLISNWLIVDTTATDVILNFTFLFNERRIKLKLEYDCL